jgi:hypothetical protein
VSSPTPDSATWLEEAGVDGGEQHPRHGQQQGHGKAGEQLRDLFEQAQGEPPPVQPRASQRHPDPGGVGEPEQAPRACDEQRGEQRDAIQAGEQRRLPQPAVLRRVRPGDGVRRADDDQPPAGERAAGCPCFAWPGRRLRLLNAHVALAHAGRGCPTAGPRG